MQTEPSGYQVDVAVRSGDIMDDGFSGEDDKELVETE
jgi:hypothetical protein